MISVVIPTLDVAHVIGPTLGALAPGLMEGMIREVIFADGGSTDETEAVAEAVGAVFLPCPGSPAARLAAGAAAARGPWLLLLGPRHRLSRDWPEAARAHIDAAPDRAGFFRRAPGRGGAVARARAALAEFRARALGRLDDEHALLLAAALQRAAAARRPGAPLGVAALATTLGRRRLARLAAFATVAGPAAS
jgi:glycosyltransferase involved in cell wall biosynthesis